jgi:hypothetical protein
VNDRISHAEPDHVLVDVKAKAFGGLRPALTPTPGAVPEQRAGCRTQDIHKFRSLRFQGIAALTDLAAEQELHYNPKWQSTLRAITALTNALAKPRQSDGARFTATRYALSRR